MGDATRERRTRWLLRDERDLPVRSWKAGAVRLRGGAGGAGAIRVTAASRATEAAAHGASEAAAKRAAEAAAKRAAETSAAKRPSSDSGDTD